MKPITRWQIAELPKREQRQLQACTNEFLGTLYAAQKRRKRIAEAMQKEESEVKE